MASMRKQSGYRMALSKLTGVSATKWRSAAWYGAQRVCPPASGERKVRQQGNADQRHENVEPHAVLRAVALRDLGRAQTAHRTAELDSRQQRGARAQQHEGGADPERDAV